MLLSNKGNIITHKNYINNGDSDRNNGNDCSSNSDSINKDYNIKIIYT